MHNTSIPPNTEQAGQVVHRRQHKKAIKHIPEFVFVREVVQAENDEFQYKLREIENEEKEFQTLWGLVCDSVSQTETLELHLAAVLPLSRFCRSKLVSNGLLSPVDGETTRSNHVRRRTPLERDIASTLLDRNIEFKQVKC